MRFYLDENLSPSIAVLARAHGLDVLDWRTAGMGGRSDEAQLLFAAHDSRCLVTRDCRDFRRLTRRFAVTGRTHAGVLCLRPSLPVWDFAAVVDVLRRVAAAHPQGFAPYQFERVGATE
jgi:hypothetical protein